jgi:hypothetical protein
MKDKEYHIYTLTDPETMELFYIGIANNISDRVRRHYYNDERKNRHIIKKMSYFSLSGIYPKVKIVKSGLGYMEALKLEAILISTIKPSCNVEHNSDNDSDNKRINSLGYGKVDG